MHLLVQPPPPPTPGAFAPRALLGSRPASAATLLQHTASVTGRISNARFKPFQ